MHNQFIETGVGIRSAHFDDALNGKASIGFFEAHSENYFGDSLPRQKLLQIREQYPVSLHGVGLSLGRADGLDKQHLQKLKRLVDELDPLFVSEHLSWSAYSHIHVPDLLPLPLTQQALNIMCEHVEQMQEALKRPILVENPSNYLLFDSLQIPEAEFLNSLSQRTGCKLLLDVNNVYVSATNLQRDPQQYLDAINPHVIGQYHLAGYSEHKDEKEQVLIDTHDHPVHQQVWELFEYTLQTLGDKPTLMEWDADLPEFNVLLAEADKAEQLRQQYQYVEPVPIRMKVELKSTETHEVLEMNKLDNIQQQFIGKLFSNQQPESANLSSESAHRFWIYQNNVQQALINYLCEVYVACHELVGSDFFRAMFGRYIAEQYPASGNIHYYGATLADFIEQFEPAKSVPYLADVARLEWAEHQAYYAADSEAVTQHSMAQYDQAEQLTLPVKLNESISLIESEFPVDEIWKQAQPDYKGEVGVSLDDGGVTLLIFKQQYQVNILKLDAANWQFLNAIQQNGNLLDAMQGSLNVLEQQQIAACIAFVLEHGLLSFNKQQSETKRIVENE